MDYFAGKLEDRDYDPAELAMALSGLPAVGEAALGRARERILGPIDTRKRKVYIRPRDPLLRRHGNGKLLHDRTLAPPSA
jgi:hypothetical protein